MTSVAHLKALIDLYWNLDRSEAWQNFYYGPRPSENGHFRGQMGKGAVSFAPYCIKLKVTKFWIGKMCQILRIILILNTKGRFFSDGVVR